MKSAPVAGAALMFAAMQIAPVTDALAKLLVVQWEHSAFQVAWARSLLQAAALAPLALLLPPRPTHPTHPARSAVAAPVRSRPKLRDGLAKHAPRGICWAGATLFFFLSLEKNTLPSALALLFVAPVAVTVFAPVFLGEKVRPQEIAATLAGFGGAILVLQPGAEFSPSLLFALLAGICYAGYILLTRHAADGSPARTVFFAGMFAALALLPFALWQWKTPVADALLAALAMGGLSALSHWMIARACVFAPASALAPLLYSEIIGATIVSYALLAELPNATAWGGIAIIIAGGAYVSASRARRETSRAK